MNSSPSSRFRLDFLSFGGEEAEVGGTLMVVERRLFDELVDFLGFFFATVEGVVLLEDKPLSGVLPGFKRGLRRMVTNTILRDAKKQICFGRQGRDKVGDRPRSVSSTLELS